MTQPDRITLVGVVGCGLMGSGIAEICARAGLDVIVREVDKEALDRGRSRLETSIGRAVHREKMTSDEAQAALARITYTTDLGDMADRELIIEAVTESEPVKLDVFATLDKVIGADTILATN